MFGVRAGRPSSCAYYYYYRYYCYYIRWVVTVGSTGYGCPHRRVRIGARFWGSGHVTYIVPYSALPLDPSMCVLTPRESPPPPTNCYAALSIYTNSRVFCRCTLKWFVLTRTFLTPRYCRCRLPEGSSWGSGVGCVRVDHTRGKWWKGML